MPNIRILSLLVLSVIFVSGCSYRPLGSGHSFSSVYIAPVKNKIDVSVDYSSLSELEKFFPDIDSDLRSSLSKRFLTDGNIKTVRQAEAGIMLNVSLLKYKKDPVRFSSGGDVEGYRVSITAEASVVDKDGSVVLPSKKIVGVTDYMTTGTNSKSESEAVQDALDDLVKRIVEYVVEQW